MQFSSSIAVELDTRNVFLLRFGPLEDDRDLYSFGMVVDHCSFECQNLHEAIRNDPKFYDFASLRLGPRVWGCSSKMLKTSVKQAEISQTTDVGDFEQHCLQMLLRRIFMFTEHVVFFSSLSPFCLCISFHSVLLHTCRRMIHYNTLHTCCIEDILS